MSEPTVLRERTPVSRKTHRCNLCTGTINPGEQYTRSTLVFDGHIYDWVECSGCVDDRIASRVFYEFGYCEDGMSSDDAYEWAVHYASGDDLHYAENFLSRWGAEV